MDESISAVVVPSRPPNPGLVVRWPQFTRVAGRVGAGSRTKTTFNQSLTVLVRAAHVCLLACFYPSKKKPKRLLRTYTLRKAEVSFHTHTRRERERERDGRTRSDQGTSCMLLDLLFFFFALGLNTYGRSRFLTS
jgi:hypothetical protein